MKIKYIFFILGILFYILFFILGIISDFYEDTNKKTLLILISFACLLKAFWYFILAKKEDI
jgi:uncharacterized membrane protein